MTTLKLSTRPAITRYGRSLSDSVRLGLDGDAACRYRWRRPRVLCVPEKKITGSTGRMHGEMPVINPPRKPISASVDHVVFLGQGELDARGNA